MKKQIILSAALLLSYGAMAQNLIMNGDFEDEFLSPAWIVNQFNTSKQTTSPVPQSGLAYVRFANPNNQYASVAQVCELKPSTQYKLSFHSYFASSGNGVNYLYAGVRGYATKEQADANSGAPAFVNLLNSGTPSYSITRPNGAPGETEWIQNEVFLTTTSTHYFLRLNFNKMYGIWNIDNVVLEESTSANLSEKESDALRFETTESALLIQSPIEGIVSLFDSNGSLISKQLLTAGENALSTLSLSKGIYFVGVKMNNGRVETFKFSKP